MNARYNSEYYLRKVTVCAIYKFASKIVTGACGNGKRGIRDLLLHPRTLCRLQVDAVIGSVVCNITKNGKRLSIDLFNKNVLWEEDLYYN